MDVLTAGNPRAHAVRVYYEGDSTIYEGMPVCYNYLTTENWFGGSVSDAGVVSATNTTAEGSQNESKYIRVVNPAVVSTSSTGTATAGVIADANLATTNLPGVGTYVSVSGTDMTDGVYKVTAVSTGVSITVATGGADVTGTSVSVSVDNLLQFAGVVKKGGWVGKTGPRVLDIYVPNGAIVPVRCDVDTTVGATALAITGASQELGQPIEGTSRVVAIAAETETDLDSTTDITLATLDPSRFIYQGSGSAALSVGAGTGDYVANSINVTSAQTTGRTTALHIKCTQTAGGGSDHYGMAFHAEGIISGTPVVHVAAASSRLTITGGTPVGWYYTGFKAYVKQTGGTISGAGIISVLNLGIQVTDTISANNFCWIYLEDNSTEKVDNFIRSTNMVALGAVTMTGDRTGNLGTTEGDYAIKVYLASQPGTQQWYIPLIPALT